jgi:hypothetical protein
MIFDIKEVSIKSWGADVIQYECIINTEHGPSIVKASTREGCEKLCKLYHKEQ